MPQHELCTTTIEDATAIIQRQDGISSLRRLSAYTISNTRNQFTANAQSLSVRFRLTRTRIMDSLHTINQDNLYNVQDVLLQAARARLANQEPTSSIARLINSNSSRIIRDKICMDIARNASLGGLFLGYSDFLYRGSLGVALLPFSYLQRSSYIPYKYKHYS